MPLLKRLDVFATNNLQHSTSFRFLSSELPDFQPLCYIPAGIYEQIRVSLFIVVSLQAIQSRMERELLLIIERTSIQVQRM